MQPFDVEFTLFHELFQDFPPILRIRNVAQILHEDVATIRARIRRGTFPIAVRQETGGRQYVLLVDLVRFIATGQPQTQPGHTLPRQMATPFNNGPSKPRGRPRKAAQLGSQK